MGNTIYLPTTENGQLTTREVALSEVELAALIIGVVMGVILIVALAALLIYAIKHKNYRRRKREEVKKIYESTIRRETNRQKYVSDGRTTEYDISSGNGNTIETRPPNYLTNTRLVQKHHRYPAPARVVTVSGSNNIGSRNSNIVVSRNSNIVSRNDNIPYYYQWWDPRSWWYYWNTRASRAPVMQYYDTRDNDYHTITQY